MAYDIVKHIRGLEKDLPELEDGRIGILEDSGNKRLVFGTVDGNVIQPSSKDFDNLESNLTDNIIGDTSQLKTINKILVQAINELYETGGNGGTGTVTGVNFVSYTYTATVDNTTTFNLSNASFDSSSDFVELFYKGVLLVPNVDYTLNGITITLNFSINTSETIYYIINTVTEMTGTKLVDGTVTKAKLETSVQTTLTNANKIGDLTTLTTTVKDTIVNSINEIDSIQIGGKNYLLNSSFSVNLNSWTGSGIISNNMLKLTATSSYVREEQDVSVLPSTQYTFGINVTNLTGSARIYLVEYNSSGTTTTTYSDHMFNLSTGRNYYTISTQSDCSSLHVIIQANNNSTVYFYNAKLEQGNRPTDWTPSSYDLVAKNEFTFVPSGAVMSFAMNTPPTGWLECNGNAISRTTYASLFSAIGTTYGTGDGSTTFNLPDMRGYFVRGWDDGRGIDNGRTFGSTQSDTVGSHDTEVLTHATSREASGYGLTQTASFPDRVMVTSVAGQGITASYTGTETRPKNIALLYCIKY